MVNLESKALKKAGFATTWGIAAGLAIGSILAPQFEKYNILKDNLTSMSATERQSEVGQYMANFLNSSTYEKISNIGERVAIDKYHAKRKSFSKH